jgi:hypothetical protein
MSKILDDFTVRVNLDGWHVRGHGTCWEGQEFHGAEILPRMVKALAGGEKFKFQGTMAPVCVLRGGTVEELKAAFKEAGLDINVAAGPAIKMKNAPAVEKPVKKESPPPPPPPVDDEEDEDEADEEDEDEDEEKEDLKATKKKKARPSHRGR